MKVIKKIIYSVLLLGAFYLTGYMYGYIIDEYSLGPRLPLGLLSLALIFLKLGLASYLSIIIHELGHLIFGLATGYSFLSFRVGSLILLKKESGYRLARYNIPGTGGQCLLDPPKLNKDGSYPYTLYNLGGGLLNLLVGLVSFLILGLGLDKFSGDLFIFGLMNIFSGLVNLLPLAGKINNDGRNQVLLRDGESRLYFWKGLKLTKELVEGKTLEEMDPFLFQYGDETGDNSLRDSILINNINLYLDRGEFDLAREKIQGLLDQEYLMGLYRNELICDLIFLEALDGNKEGLDKLLSPSMEKYIEATSKYFIARKRLEYAMELLIEDDLDQAAESLAEFNRLARNYPYPGEIRIERKLIDRINKIYEAKDPEIK